MTHSREELSAALSPESKPELRATKGGRRATATERPADGTQRRRAVDRLFHRINICRSSVFSPAALRWLLITALTQPILVAFEAWRVLSYTSVGKKCLRTTNTEVKP